MDTVQFDPRITTDLQIDWRRQGAGQGADPFSDLLADQLKKRADSDQQDIAARRRHQAADPISGRRPGIVIAHARTLRGEAKEIDNPDDRSLPDRTERAVDEGCAAAIEETPVPDESAAGADPSGQDDTAEVETDAETAASAEQPVAPVEDQAQPADPAPTIVVVTQPAEQQAAGSDPEIAVILPVPTPAEGESAAPAQADQAANTPPNGSQTNTDAEAEQQAVAAMAEAGLSEVAVALTVGEGVPAGSAAPAPAVVTQPAPLPAAMADGEQPLLQMPQAPAPVAELAPAQPKSERPAMDIKLRSGTPARTHAGVPDPAPSSAAVPQSAQPQQTTLLRPAGELSGMGEAFDQPLSADGAGPGWALHLAQGAAGKRADFVAQLRQHLQNLPAHEQVAVHIQRAMREGTGKFSIQLSPAELGNIHVKLEIDEEKRVTAAVTVERPSTLELLQRDIKGLERALHNAGLSMEGGDLSFSLGGGDQDFAQDLNQSGASAAGNAVSEVQSEGELPDSPAAQVMDTAAGIVNLQV